MTDVMRERGTVVNSAAQMLSSGDVNLDTMPQLILRIINEGMWRQRAIPQRRWELSREFATFEEFVTADPLDGLHTTIPMLKDVCRRDVRAVDAIDRLLTRQGTSRIMPGTMYPVTDPPSRATRRSRRFAASARIGRTFTPASSLSELSAHAAAVEAGFRPHTFTVRADNADSAAATLRKHFKDPEQRALLAELLTKED